MKLKYLKIIIQLLCDLDFAASPSIPGHCNERLADQNNPDTTEVFSQSLGLLQVSCCQVSPLMSSVHSLSFLYHPRAHIDRVKKAEGVETDEKECPAAEPEEEPEASGAMVITNITLLTITITNINPPQAMVTNNTTFLTIATTILAIFQLSHL